MLTQVNKLICSYTGFNNGSVLGLYIVIGRILLKQVFYQDVLTCWYNIVVCLVSSGDSMKSWFMWSVDQEACVF